MSKGRKVMCSYCREQFYKEDLVEDKSKRYCKPCFERRKQDAQDYKDLIKYICDGFGIEKPTGPQLKSIKKFKDELGYTYKGIQYTLYYIFCVEGKKTYGTSIELVQFYYEKAKYHASLVENARASAKNIDLKEVVIQVPKYKKPKVEKTRFIDIANIV